MYSANTPYTSSRRPLSQPTNGIPKFVWFLGVLVVVFIVWRLFVHQSVTTESGDALTIRSGTGASVSLYMTPNSKKTIDGEEKLYVSDTKASVTSKEAIFRGDGVSGYIAERGEIAYLGKMTNGEQLQVINGYVWIESDGQNSVKLKNFALALSSDTTIIAYQTAIASTVYVLKGSAKVEVGDQSEQISAGRQLTLQNTDAKLPDFHLSDEVTTIDAVLQQNDFFLAHHGDDLLSQITTLPDDGSGTTSTGILMTGSGGTRLTGSGGIALGSTASKLQITTPENGSTLKKTIFDIEGTISDPAVTKVTIDNKDASVSPVDQTFIYKGFEAKDEITDITYKAYIGDTQVEVGTLTVYASKNSIEKSEKPTVVSYPVSDAQFQIIAPVENPYKTTESVVRMEGTVPKDIVKYITINGFRLTKFVPYSTKWYYFANQDYATMNEGINLYTIRYYDANGKILSERLFTIVKEKSAE